MAGIARVCAGTARYPTEALCPASAPVSTFAIPLAGHRRNDAASRRTLHRSGTYPGRPSPIKAGSVAHPSGGFFTTRREDIAMTNTVDFRPCLQCAPAESKPDGPAQCRPEVCPRYRTMGPGRPAQIRRPATKRKPTPFLLRCLCCLNPHWPSWNKMRSTRLRKNYDNGRGLRRPAGCGRSAIGPAGL